MREEPRRLLTVGALSPIPSGTNHDVPERITLGSVILSTRAGTTWVAPGRQWPEFAITGQTGLGRCADARRAGPLELGAVGRGVMTSRIGRVGPAIAAAVLVLTAACDQSVSGAPTAGENPHLFAAKEAFGQAVAELESRPLMRYTSTVAGADSEQVAVTVSRTGSAYGTSNAGGNKLTLAVLDDRLYVRASRQYWRDLGAKSNEAKEFAGRLVIADPADIGYDPARLLTPKEVASALREAFQKEHQTETTTAPSTSSSPSGSSKPPEPKSKVERLEQDGTEVYRIPIGKHSVDVTVTQPHRIVATDLPLASAGVEPLVPEGSRTAFGVGDEDDLRKLYGSLAKAAKGAKSTGVLVPDFQLQEGAGKLDCQVGGKCTAKVRVDNSLASSQQLPVTRFEVRMKATLNATGLGTRSCTDTASMRPNKGTSMSCTADFALAPSYTPRSYPVRATWTITALAQYLPNVKLLAKHVSQELADLLDEV
jgi:hypothetical protein